MPIHKGLGSLQFAICVLSAWQAANRAQCETGRRINASLLYINNPGRGNVTARICGIESCTVDSEGNFTDFGICSLYDPFIAAVNGDLRAGRLGEDWPDNSTGQGRHISRGDFNA